VLLGVLAIAPAFASPHGASEEPDVSSAIFYYPWYGTPRHDGAFQHWQQNGAQPPSLIAAAYFPARGLYSSTDRAVVGTQMRQIASTGVDQVVVSWWGRGSLEDQRLGPIAAAARTAGLSVAAHVEPYPGRNAVSVGEDVAYLAGHGITDVYLYRPEDLPAEEWTALNDGLAAPTRIFAQTGHVGYAAAGHFAGVYTYDIVVWGGAKLRRICTAAHEAGLLCAPSVGPGYDARRSSGDFQLKPRRFGATYDAMWRAALASGADAVTITSYNEWHEGTQIEPARFQRGYKSYEGAWGLRGIDARRAYVDRTAFWILRLESRL
jgi:glycoprotein endo-alpha-1,2-mannosidase